MSAKMVTSDQVFKDILAKKDVFILDVRNEEEYNDWKIEGKTVTSLNIPYFDFLDGTEAHLDKLPKDKPILVVCAKEGSSKFVADQLVEAGLDASYLQGGMKEWSQYYYATPVVEEDNFKLYQVNRVSKGCLSYVVVSDGEALVLDPARHVDEYIQLAEKDGAKITHILDSHLHADHISGARDLVEKTGAKYYLMKSEGANYDHEALEDYDEIKFNNVKVEVLAVKTPGHTPGSVSFFINDKYLLSGDTIFVGGLGRPDLGGKVKEWAQDLYNTVFEKIAEIADDVLVLPAHFADIKSEMADNGIVGETLGNIRKNNEIMQTTDKDAFLAEVEKSASSVKPPNFEKIVGINRGELTPSSEEAVELEIGPNRCAVHHTA
ncbi:MAG: MBL fold metallo-hydrolase [Bacillaceae bacterium]|nr:MBL fold metallo-hydrolase [Bacillaceae bacterium]